MTKTATVHARLESSLKHRAEAVFNALGINPTQAITIFYRQIEINGGLPFKMMLPTEMTQQIFEGDRLIFERMGTHSDSFE